MRVWSIHPRYLDAKGLVALWREGLLAQSVLCGKTVGYTNHPQLIRFRATRNPEGAIATYLRAVLDEARHRGYTFDGKKIRNRRYRGSVPVTSGQCAFERTHLLNKLRVRDHQRYLQLQAVQSVVVHPLFVVVAGEVESWEVVH